MQISTYSLPRERSRFIGIKRLSKARVMRTLVGSSSLNPSDRAILWEYTVAARVITCDISVARIYLT